jgi:tRNA nucleotidyltransferase (CCA-adding enzyme)
MNDYPNLPFASDMEEGIFNVDDAIYEMSADLGLDSLNSSARSNSEILVDWLQEQLKQPRTHLTETPHIETREHSSNTIAQHLQGREPVDMHPEALRQRILEHNPEMLDVARVIATQVATQDADPAYPHNTPKALLYGGFVRDALLGYPTKDADMQVFGLKPERLKAVLQDCFPSCTTVEGNRYPVFRIKCHDGGELKVGIQQDDPMGVAKDMLDIIPSMTPEQSALFCDFTINALYADPLSGEVYDYCNGLQDIQSRCLRMLPQEYFYDSPACFLRVYRACHLIARFALHIEDGTRDFLKRQVQNGALHRTSPHFSSEALKKIFTLGELPSLGICALYELGVLDCDFPEILLLIQAELDEELTQSTPWSDTLLGLERAAQLLPIQEDSSSSQNRLCVLLSVLFKQVLQIQKQEQSEAHLVESIQQALSIFLLGSRAAASIISALISEKAFLNLCNEYNKKQSEQALTTNAVPGRSAGRKPGGIMPFAAKREREIDQCKECLYRFLDCLWPTPLEVFLIFAHACELSTSDSALAEKRLMMESLVLEHNVDLGRPGPLIDREYLVRTLKIPGGLHIGLIIGDVEKRRLHLIGRQCARDYLKRNLNRVFKRVNYVPETGGNPTRK